jgi:hypothetical protein
MDNTAWVYCDKPLKINDLEQYWGFVYKITKLSTNEFYIGSKSFFSRTNGKISKKRSNELYSGKGRKPLREKKVKESDWKTYKSSSKKVQAMIAENPNDFKYEIHQIYETKAEMLLTEAYLIIKEFMFKNSLILNEWISIRSQKLK